jgi:hypothetical protein
MQRRHSRGNRYTISNTLDVAEKCLEGIRISPLPQHHEIMATESNAQEPKILPLSNSYNRMFKLAACVTTPIRSCETSTAPAFDGGALNGSLSPLLGVGLIPSSPSRSRFVEAELGTNGMLMNVSVDSLNSLSASALEPNVSQ